MCRGFLGLQNRAVENWWSVLKTGMKQMLPELETVRECVDAAFKNCPNVFAYCYSMAKDIIFIGKR